MKLEPNPGSREALAAGCRCPVLDNAHGADWFGEARGGFWVNEGCPLHNPVPPAKLVKVLDTA